MYICAFEQNTRTNEILCNSEFENMLISSIDVEIPPVYVSY
jgi:hypothetical protein